MKLFLVDYMDDCDIESFLTVGNSEEEVAERMAEELPKKLSCYMGSWVHEIDEVEGYRIIVEESK